MIAIMKPSEALLPSQLLCSEVQAEPQGVLHERVAFPF